MSIFTECIVNGKTELVDNWDKIFNEYLSISGDTHISAILELMKSITMIENKLKLIQFCVDQLAEKHLTGLAELLKEMGFRFGYEDGPELQGELELTVTQAKNMLIRLNQDKAELEELRKGEKGAATMQDYEKQYSAIEEFKGCVIDPEKYMVSRYTADVARMKERYNNGERR